MNLFSLRVEKISFWQCFLSIITSFVLLVQCAQNSSTAQFAKCIRSPQKCQHGRALQTNFAYCKKTKNQQNLQKYQKIAVFLCFFAQFLSFLQNFFDWRFVFLRFGLQLKSFWIYIHIANLYHKTQLLYILKISWVCFLFVLAGLSIC